MPDTGWGRDGVGRARLWGLKLSLNHAPRVGISFTLLCLKEGTMKFRYGCFLSYAHGSHALMSRFNHEFADMLRAYLEPHFDNEIELFVDTDQLGGGDDIDRRIADAQWNSACMVLIYTPKYEAHLNTRREFAAMLELERLRRTWGQLPSRLVIPVVMRRHSALPLPPQVMQAFYLDFSAYTLATGDLKSHPEFVPQIETLANKIGMLYHVQKKIAVPAGFECNQFALPEVTPQWRDTPDSDFPKI